MATQQVPGIAILVQRNKILKNHHTYRRLRNVHWHYCNCKTNFMNINIINIINIINQHYYIFAVVCNNVISYCKWCLKHKRSHSIPETASYYTVPETAVLSRRPRLSQHVLGRPATKSGGPQMYATNAKNTCWTVRCVAVSGDCDSFNSWIICCNPLSSGFHKLAILLLTFTNVSLFGFHRHSSLCSYLLPAYKKRGTDTGNKNFKINISNRIVSYFYLL